MTLKEQRKARLLPNGIPRYIRCYDNGGETFDRYTVLFTGRYAGRPVGRWEYIAASENPFHPQGFGQHGETLCKGGAHLGKRIKFEALPLDVQKFAMQDYTEMWRL